MLIRSWKFGENIGADVEDSHAENEGKDGFRFPEDGEAGNQ